MGFDRYRRRVTVRGNNAKEIILNERIQSFNDYLDKSISGQEVVIDGMPYLVGLQDVKFHDERSREAKYLFTNLDVPASVGSVVEWDNNNWIIVLRENETIKTHLTFFMTRCNEVLTWQDEHKTIYQIPCILADKTSVYSDGLSKTEHLQLGTDQISINIPSNDLTEKIPLNKRLIFKQDSNNIYEVSRKDNMLNNGLILLVAKKSLYNPNTDHLEYNLADYDGKFDPDIPNPDMPVEGAMRISGLEYFTIWDEGEEYVVNTGKPIKWSLDREDLIKITKVEDNKCWMSSTSTSLIGKSVLRAELIEDASIFTELLVQKFYQ